MGRALAVVIAIYSTLGLARTLTETLLNRDLLTAAFGLGMVLVRGAIVTQGLKTSPDIAEIGVVLGIVATYFMVFTRMALPGERSHLIEYGVVASSSMKLLQNELDRVDASGCTGPARNPDHRAGQSTRRMNPSFFA